LGRGRGGAMVPPGSPWENSYCESFNGKIRDELLDWYDILGHVKEGDSDAQNCVRSVLAAWLHSSNRLAI